MGKQNSLREEKNMRCNRGEFQFFASSVLKSVEAPVLINHKIISTALSHEVQIPRLFGFFLQQETFQSYKSVGRYDYFSKHY